jgi:hypothetical protein
MVPGAGVEPARPFFWPTNFKSVFQTVNLTHRPPNVPQRHANHATHARYAAHAHTFFLSDFVTVENKGSKIQLPKLKVASSSLVARSILLRKSLGSNLQTLEIAQACVPRLTELRLGLNADRRSAAPKNTGVFPRLTKLRLGREPWAAPQRICSLHGVEENYVAAVYATTIDQVLAVGGPSEA